MNTNINWDKPYQRCYVLFDAMNRVLKAYLDYKTNVIIPSLNQGVPVTFTSDGADYYLLTYPNVFKEICLQ
jgi:hypothetical protein